MTTSTATAEQLAIQYIEGYNEREEDKIIELFSPTVNWDGHEVSRDEVDHEVWWNAFPDLHLSLERVISDGNEAAFRLTVTGTHEGDFGDIEPSGESIEITEIIIISTEHGKINELWFEWDELGFFDQLEVLEHPIE